MMYPYLCLCPASLVLRQEPQQVKGCLRDDDDGDDEVGRDKLCSRRKKDDDSENRYQTTNVFYSPEASRLPRLGFKTMREPEKEDDG